MTDLSYERTIAAARALSTGKFGSFAAAIGDAGTCADRHNLGRLHAAFPELFNTALSTLPQPMEITA
jgi:hypothetical protein